MAGNKRKASPGRPRSGDNSPRDIEAYTHDGATRVNNPPAGVAHHDRQAETRREYAFDPHLDPSLQWAGKAEGLSFSVPTSSIHIHESVKPHKIIRAVQSLDETDPQRNFSFFETPGERLKRRREAIEFYRHGLDWTNRLIAGDSLVVMNSLLEKEGLAGGVRAVYIDPPYGIKYGSNFQPFVDQREVKDKKDQDLTQEPEMITAFRDTWELGIHSYLTYLRNRLLLARELLAESGSAFVQISDENVHLARCLCDEVFGTGNFAAMIYYRTTGGFETTGLSRIGDFILWYAKDKKSQKYHQLFEDKDMLKGDEHGNYRYVQLPDGSRRAMTLAERQGQESLPAGSKIYMADNLTSQGPASGPTPFKFEGAIYNPQKNNHWKPNYPLGLERLVAANRVTAIGNNLRYIRFIEDYPVKPINNAWLKTGVSGFTSDKQYVVQTNAEVIQRCLLMTTDPGDLVLDITCGSGTTAYVAEKWGRRWITCDTSRVALTLAKKRLMTAVYDYYKLARPEQGVAAGFVYKTVPHITLKSIANQEPPERETLYDQPEIDKTKIRVSGPFTVEALPAPVVKPLDEVTAPPEDFSAKQTDWRAELLATGILGRGGDRLEFSRVEPLPGTRFLQAEAETQEPSPRRAVVCFAGETKPLDARRVALALDEAENLRPKPGLIVFAAFQFDPEAAKDIDDTRWPGVDLLKVQMNADLMTEDLKKRRSSNQSFWLVGQPDVELLRLAEGPAKGRFIARIRGFDYYDVKKGEVISGDPARIALWMLDTDYDGLCVEPSQVFFPLDGEKAGWNRLAKTLKAEINQDLIKAYAGTESLPFALKPETKIAVKIVDDRGLESLKVLQADASDAGED